MELGWTETVHSRGIVRSLGDHHRAFGPQGDHSWDLAGLERGSVALDVLLATVAEVVEIVLCLHYAWRRVGQHRWSAPVSFAPGIFLRLNELRPGMLRLVLGLGFGPATSGLAIPIMRVFVVVLEYSVWLVERASYCQQTSQSYPSRSQLRVLTQNPSLCPHADSYDWRRRLRWQRTTGGSH